MSKKIKVSPAGHKEKIKKVVRWGAIIIVAIVVLTVVVLAEIWFKKNNGAPRTWRAYSNQNYNTRFDYPSDWAYNYRNISDQDKSFGIIDILDFIPLAEKDRIDLSSVCQEKPDDASCLVSGVSVTIQKNEGKLPLAEWTQKNIGSFISSQKEITLTSGVKALEMKEAQSVGNHTIVAIGQPDFITIISDDSGKDADAQKVFQKMSSSFNFINPVAQ